MPLTVNFMDRSHDRDGTIVAWMWDFGDGTTSTEANPTHTYTSSSEPSGRRLALLAAAFAVVIAACGSASSDAAPGATEAPINSGTPAPATSFALFDGTQASLASFAGRPVVVNFWASWCPSCVAEMSAAFRPVQEQLGDSVTFVGMNIQDDRALALELLTDTGVQWVSAEDPDGDLYLALGGISMPFTVFISPSGEVLDKHNGPLNEAQLRDRISDVLGV